MITETQLNEAIAEMNGQRHPDANTCLKLASYYTIRNELFPKTEQKPEQKTVTEQYYYSGDSETGTIDYVSETDFGKVVYGKKTNDVLANLDSIMSALFVIDPPLYKRVLRDLEG